MKRLWIIPVMVAIALLIGMQIAAQAAPYIEVVVIDSSAGGNPILWPTAVVQSDSGTASFDGGVGGWTVKATGITYPFSGSTQSSPYIALNVEASTSTSAGGSMIVFTDAIGYTGPISGGMTGPFHFEAEGTVADGTTGSMDLFALYNSNNVLFESGGTPFTIIGTLGTFTAGAFSDEINIAAFPGTTSPYALGIQGQFTHDGVGSTTFNSSLGSSQIPEPTTMLLLGSGLLVLWGFRKMFKK